MSFRNAVVQHNNGTFTTNGMPALKSTLNACVDLFGSAAASRGKDIIPAFAKALGEDREMALRLVLWLRDVREGQGERKLFRDVLQYLEAKDEKALEAIFPLIPEMGRWDDLLVFKTLQWKDAAARFIFEALKDGNSLCAKWMPRKGVVANELRSMFGWTPKLYRKTLVTLSDTVEQKMCAGKWNEIEFSKLPSVASARYQKAFNKRCPEAYAEYKAALTKGEAKINAGAVYPHDIVKSVYNGDADVANAQWKALPNWMEEGVGILPMIDVSGSMSCPAGGTGPVTCMHVAIALGIYMSERQTGAFKDMYLTFHDQPTLNIMQSEKFSERVSEVAGAEWGGSTNVMAGVELILQLARRENVAQEDMPKYLVVLSDMQFNGYSFGGGKTAFKNMADRFRNYGYEMPKVVFWNLNDYGNKPTKYSEEGVAMVSGFSPSLMKSILASKDFTPYDVMVETLMKPRYNLAQ